MRRLATVLLLATATAAVLVPGPARSAAPTDPLAVHQWGLTKIRAYDVWASSTGAGVKVAVVDSGVDLQHPDLQCPGKLEVVAGSDVVVDGGGPDDVRGSGTHAAGIIGACTNNGIGIAGVAPGAVILPIQVTRSSGAATFADVAAGVRLAADSGAHVINVSVTPSVGALSYVPDLFAELESAVSYASSKGAVVVAPAGNDSMPMCESPALVEDVVCVGATDARDLKAWYSTFPSKPGPNELTVSAPGGTEHLLCGNYAESVVSLWPPELDTCDDGLEGYLDRNGTNVSTAFVSGLAALLYQQAGVRTLPARDQVVQRLVWTADDLGVPGQDPLFGFGRVNAVRAIGLAQAPVLVEIETAAVGAAAFTEFRCIARVTGAAAFWTEFTKCHTYTFTGEIHAPPVRQPGNVVMAGAATGELNAPGLGPVCWEAATMVAGGRIVRIAGCGTTRPLWLNVTAHQQPAFQAVVFSCTATAQGSVAQSTEVSRCWTYDYQGGVRSAASASSYGNHATAAGAFLEWGPRSQDVCWDAWTTFLDGIRLTDTGCT